MNHIGRAGDSQFKRFLDVREAALWSDDAYFRIAANAERLGSSTAPALATALLAHALAAFALHFTSQKLFDEARKDQGDSR